MSPALSRRCWLPYVYFKYCYLSLLLNHPGIHSPKTQWNPSTGTGCIRESTAFIAGQQGEPAAHAEKTPALQLLSPEGFYQQCEAKGLGVHDQFLLNSLIHCWRGNRVMFSGISVMNLLVSAGLGYTFLWQQVVNSFYMVLHGGILVTARQLKDRSQDII